jgi:cysteinyl-tRNA synthetase
MALTVYNTLSRSVQPFTPLHGKHVTMYVCGPTVYGHSHLGHAKSYVSFDVIVRYLRFLGYTVLYVQNITDVGHLSDDADEGEDKILKQAAQDRVHPMQVAELYTRSYFEDMDALNVLRADICPRATGHITEQIAMVEDLLAKGFAYEANGSVYYDVAKFSGYGKLSGRTVEDLVAGHRIDVNPEKRHPADFALWKRAESGHILRWPSPWGEGFPGWHIECSAMSTKYLGESIDIHGGGLENQFPHHECEIAQTEGVTGKPFVKYWLHNNMVTVDGRKMGKSLGNFIALKDAFMRWRPQVVRFFILQSHYRSTLDFSDDALEGAARGFEKLANTLRNLREALRNATDRGEPFGIELNSYKTSFLTAMDDDFNTPQALAVLFDLAREVNQIHATGKNLAAQELRQAVAFFEECGGTVLGLSFDDHSRTSESDDNAVAKLMELLIAVRTDVRAQKLWVVSDKIRDGLTKIGFALEDKREGTQWKKMS